MADSELATKLARQAEIGQGLRPATKVSQSVYAEFKEFPIEKIKELRKVFQKYDVDKSNFIDMMELKLMMEKIGAPQTHLGLKQMIREVDEDNDSQISFREFMLIFRKAAAGDFEEGSGLNHIYQQINEVDVDKEGVGGAKNFFEAKINDQARSNKFEEEIRQEQEKKRIEEELAKERRAAFKEKAAMFK